MKAKKQKTEQAPKVKRPEKRLQAAHLILGDQLFDLEILKDSGVHPHSHHLILIESLQLCVSPRHHKQKIFLFLAAMRKYREEAMAKGYRVLYRKIDESLEEWTTNGNSPQPGLCPLSYCSLLSEVWNNSGLASCSGKGDLSLSCFEIDEPCIADDIKAWAESEGLSLILLESPKFFLKQKDVLLEFKKEKKLFMKTFYEKQRRRFGYLMQEEKPMGGQFSFDSMNRKKLPKNISLADPPLSKLKLRNRQDPELRELANWINVAFSEHAGQVDISKFCWDLDRAEALESLGSFVNSRLPIFGPYQDALTNRSDFVFHSLLSPALNMGLLTPREVIEKACSILTEFEGLPRPPSQAFHDIDGKILLGSLEGFLRQILGWREFVRGIFLTRRDQMQNTNYWNHHRTPKESFLNGKTGLAPFDFSVRKLQRTGYAHHIERLMVQANLFNLCEISPEIVYRWFMEQFIDSSEWVMHANVYGMGLMSDGGIFATKPYICGSNYLLKMGDFPKGPWCEVWDGLYWRWISRNKETLKRNPRMSLVTKQLEKMNHERKEHLECLAEDFLAKHTKGA